MKKLTCVLMIVFCLALSGCSFIDFPSDLNDYEGSRWVAQEIDLYFDVSSDYDRDYGCHTVGSITIEGQQMQVAVSFSYAGEVEFERLQNGRIAKYSSDADVLFSGDIGRGVDRKGETFTMEITERQPGYIDDSITTITFVREDMPEE